MRWFESVVVPFNAPAPAGTDTDSDPREVREGSASGSHTDTDGKDLLLRVHYLGWSSRYDETLSRFSRRGFLLD